MALKHILKTNGLVNQPDAPTGYKFVGFEGETYSEKTTDTISGIGGSTAMVYVAGLVQGGTSDPSASEGVNTTGSTITFTRTTQGTYTITSTSPIFKVNKWSITLNNAVTTSDLGQNQLDHAVALFIRTSDTSIVCQTFWSNAGTQVQDSMISGQIKIEVWS